MRFEISLIKALVKKLYTVSRYGAMVVADMNQLTLAGWVPGSTNQSKVHSHKCLEMDPS